MVKQMIIETDAIRLMLEESGWHNKAHSIPIEGRECRQICFSSCDSMELEGNEMSVKNYSCMTFDEYWKYTEDEDETL